MSSNGPNTNVIISVTIRTCYVLNAFMCAKSFNFAIKNHLSGLLSFPSRSKVMIRRIKLVLEEFEEKKNRRHSKSQKSQLLIVIKFMH